MATGIQDLKVTQILPKYLILSLRRNWLGEMGFGEKGFGEKSGYPFSEQHHFNIQVTYIIAT
ncbi:hypothetical protein RirG_266820 [Rhizophagus irregularis DAOM 197198w]|uniref:Uncharacterized protein n=1 Tax=Rhizophagus irregularis (strain DAOM 197198w) TaxID=1432141 RepID=A0A015IAL8_RHIIW|nr:hypothetical protein RirG_266820 [Rhizophagus irregularis DAOM 197198w]